MKKIRLIAITLLLLLTLSSCNLTNFDTNSMLTAPLMGPSEQNMRKAISDAIGSSYEPVYPKSGSYQTAISLIDITKSNTSEAVCFYKTLSDQYVHLIVLQNVNGKWTSMGIAESQAMGVDRIDFCDITNDGKKELVVGWQYLSGEEKALEIFSLSDNNELKSKYTGMYNDFIVSGSCITVISKNTAGKTASASLISSAESGISVTNTVSLNNSIAGFTKIQTSEISNTNTLIYIDEQLESQTYTTELLLLNTKDKPTLNAINLENRTMRTRAYVCIDADDDEIIDLPVEKILPSYIRNGTEEALSYVDWYKISDSELKFIKSTYSSVNEPFYIELPQEWTDKITIEKNPDSERIIHFYELENKQPMFSIRVFSRQEYTDSSEKDIWQEITTSGENVYTFRQDSKNISKTFKTDIKTIAKLFVVLS